MVISFQDLETRPLVETHSSGHSSWRLSLVCAVREVLRRSEELGSEEEGTGRGKQVAKSKGRKEGQKEGAGRGKSRKEACGCVCWGEAIVAGERDSPRPNSWFMVEPGF